MEQIKFQKFDDISESWEHIIIYDKTGHICHVIDKTVTFSELEKVIIKEYKRFDSSDNVSHLSNPYLILYNIGCCEHKEFSMGVITRTYATNEQYNLVGYLIEDLETYNFHNRTTYETTKIIADSLSYDIRIKKIYKRNRQMSQSEATETIGILLSNANEVGNSFKNETGEFEQRIRTIQHCCRYLTKYGKQGKTE